VNIGRPVAFVLVILSVAVSPGLLGASARQASASPVSVRVAAAADLKFALDEVASQLGQRRPPIRLEVTYGSSGSMPAQLRQRAPFDLYLSADVGYPRDLIAQGIGTASDLFVYATGRIVVWVPQQSRLPVERDGLRALEGAARVAIANPRHAPYGRAAEEALRAAGVWAVVSKRLALGENVAQAAQFVQSGAADAGIVAKSLALAPAMRDAGRYWEVPAEHYSSLTQGGLVLPWAVSRPAATAVRDYLLSDAGRQLLVAHGFGLPSR
jgi:molybdate transport system substrate-binding protein